MEPIYLDNNATTPLLPAVRAAMLPYFDEVFGNPASAHRAGQRARRALEDAREQLAALLDAAPDEVLFTSGATESNNLALFGLAGEPPGHLLTSPVEHPSVHEPLRQLAERGCSLTYLPVDAVGRLNPADLPALLRADTRLLVVQLANHETGVVQPLLELAGVGHDTPRLAVHTDATQAVGKLPVRFHELGVDTLSCSAHKFHGPKGIGALLVRRGCPLRPLFHGGQQQQARRPGTEPVPLVVGMVAALALAHQEATTRRAHLLGLRRRFLELLHAQAAPVVLNGPTEGEPGFGLPHTLNLSFPGCRADALLMNLDLAGIACSTGSACSSGSLLPSPVLQAMGVSAARLASAMRFSLSSLITETALAEAAQRIAQVVRRLRHCP